MERLLSELENRFRRVVREELRSLALASSGLHVLDAHETTAPVGVVLTRAFASLGAEVPEDTARRAMRAYIASFPDEELIESESFSRGEVLGHPVWVVLSHREDV